jgi:hypothetical protein
LKRNGGHTRAMMAMSMMDGLAPVEGMGPVGEVRIKPDPDTFVIVRAGIQPRTSRRRIIHAH